MYKVYEVKNNKFIELIKTTDSLTDAIKTKKSIMLYTTKCVKIIDTTTNKEVKTQSCLHQTRVYRNNYIKMY